MTPNNVSKIILRFVTGLLPNQFGKKSLSKFLIGNRYAKSYKPEYELIKGFGKLSKFTNAQVLDFIEQLIKQEYLKVEYVELNIPIIVITDKGFNSLNSNQDITITLPNIYELNFEDAKEIKKQDDKLINEYAIVKKELKELTLKEENLKNRIKELMTIKKLDQINSNEIDLFLKEKDVITYPKADIEKTFPEDILKKIRKVRKIQILTSRFKN